MDLGDDSHLGDVAGRIWTEQREVLHGECGSRSRPRPRHDQQVGSLVFIGVDYPSELRCTLRLAVMRRLQSVDLGVCRLPGCARA